MQQISAKKKPTTRLDMTRLGKKIHWESCKILKVDHSNKWYMLKSESFLENKTKKILWDFENQTDQLNPAKTPDVVIFNKTKKRESDEY